MIPTTRSLPTTTCNIIAAASSSSSTALKYAIGTSASDGPMSMVDSTRRGGGGGGCPFLVANYAHRTYAVPALFNDVDSRPIVLFDGECNLCNKLVQTLLKYDSGGNMRFAAFQSRVGDLLLRRMSNELRAEVLSSTPPNDDISGGGGGGGGGGGDGEGRYESIVVCCGETTYIRSSAVYRILQSLDGPSKRLRLIQYMSLVGYVLPTRIRDWIYRFVSNRRRAWFSTSEECLLWDDRFEDRFVDDGVLTGRYRDPHADPHADIVVPTGVDLFRGENPPVRGDGVRIIWPSTTNAMGRADDDPSISYDDEFPDGICLIGGTGKISTVDLPMRVVLRVDRESIGLKPDVDGEPTLFAWVRPEEIALL
ncbi:hypothetical protein ACHAXA_002567 [Cyclostephanos tholiformis]|uniref:DUF393 domain-containing protein n=1 Tax=Cyclostephanos tholiformis TaxID=382380 RepID=A0ABD3RBB5_9STRA